MLSSTVRAGWTKGQDVLKGMTGRARKRGAQVTPADVGLYNRTSSLASRQVISTYSSSFSLATCLLDARMREDIRNLYAVVRIADEIVDGTAEHAGLGRDDIVELLDSYERAVLAAPTTRFSTDPVLQAYGRTAERCSINPEHVTAFFHSMRMDLHQATHDAESLGEYIYGSAEVIGLMCLDIFLAERTVTDEERATMVAGARALGAAFQKINFLRDYAEDVDGLGRIYFPDALRHGLTDEAKRVIIADIREDLETADRSIDLLPFGARAGVIAAMNLFAELTDAIDALPAEQVRHERVSVSSPRKAAIAARALLEAPRRRQK